MTAECAERFLIRTRLAVMVGHAFDAEELVGFLTQPGPEKVTRVVEYLIDPKPQDFRLFPRQSNSLIANILRLNNGELMSRSIGESNKR